MQAEAEIGWMDFLEDAYREAREVGGSDTFAVLSLRSCSLLSVRAGRGVIGSTVTGFCFSRPLSLTQKFPKIPRAPLV